MESVVTRQRRYNVDDYYGLLYAGVLTEDDRVELIEGEIIRMPPIGDDHGGCVGWMTWVLTHRLGSHALVWVQNPLRLDEWSEPLPDFVVLPMRPEIYRHRHPRPDDALLVIEVSDTTLRHDRGRKLPLYARSGIPEVWIVVLRTGRIEVYREPTADGYRSKTVLGRGDSLSPAAFPDLTFAVEELLGPQDDTAQ